MKYIATLALGLLIAANAQAQNNDKLVIKPSGRILFDGAMYKANTDKELFNSGMAIPDARVGFSAKTGKWSAKVDVGYAYGKVGMKDVFIEHHFDTKTLCVQVIISTSLAHNILPARPTKYPWKSHVATKYLTILV